MHRVTVLPDGVCFPGRPGETILDTVVRGGFRYPYACRRGGCATCKVQLAAGRVGYPRRVAATVLCDAERAAGVCLTCRAVPDGDVVIRLREGDRLRCVSPIRFGQPLLFGQQGVQPWV
jgi:CDP-4-dehydro-6-deoxyglucose reductase